MSTLAAKELAKRFSGDLSIADWRHFGRLEGFTYRKPERLLPIGLAPFVRLRQCEGRVYYATSVFLEEVNSVRIPGSRRTRELNDSSADIKWEPGSNAR